MDKSHSSQSYSMLPQRVVLAIMGTLAIAVSYTIRSSLPVALTEMVVPVNNTNNLGQQLRNSTIPRYNWTQSQQQWALSSFYIGYVLAHIPGGLIAEKIGGKWICSGGILFMAFFNGITPVAVECGGGLWALIVLRIMVGVGGGTTYPALSVMLAAWVPEKERGKIGTFVFGGGQIGCLLSFFFTGLILEHYAWDKVFYFWTIVAVFWFVLFTVLCYNDPESHPRIPEKELTYLKSELGQTKRNDDLPPTPWKSIIFNVPVIAMAICLIGHDWIFYIMSADLPKYLKDVLELKVKEIGLYSSMPFLLMWIVSLFSGFMSDYLVNRKLVTITQARKIFTTLGSVFPAIFLVAASYGGYNRPIVIFLFTIVMGFLGCFFSGVKVNALDLSPNYAGSLMAVTNGLAGMAGVVVLPIIGVLTPQSSLEQWRFVFWLTFVVTMLRTIIFLIFGSAEIQKFNNPRIESRNRITHVDRKSILSNKLIPR
ncbi:putative inorganic phosphate cotransporter [Contarinia nasturtii]|uniref:putative inorganic phosphate cotransporter n=1 Tax=Contarinia nasturtii TaxID=265458 RepID=UPI0012D407D8|nr:putative inorganic phosphate cotransporter [Contarinia nasturtii]XP_031626510.1 putative inorganic phosphate cotransporter [Contarinia nasturtii]XP_031626511.1 putative inorganic phosphate cotransporter [Contarinia nasturtii]XP_031626512.1 putative inorganic phosphate cotransporter [Contarinia nasturtii]